MGNFKDVAVIDVLVKPGDAIEVDGPLITLETEKATMDVPSSVAGIIEKIIATKGGTISPGDVVATVQVADAAAAAPAAAPAPSHAGGVSTAPRRLRPRRLPAPAAPAAAQLPRRPPLPARRWPPSTRAASPRPMPVLRYAASRVSWVSIWRG